MLGKLFNAFRSEKREKADPEGKLYSAVYNETTAQGHFLGRQAIDRCKEMLAEARSGTSEPPILQARRAYAGYKAVEAKFAEILTEYMKEWLEEHHSPQIRSLNLAAIIDELLPQAVDPSLARFREQIEGMFDSSTEELLRAELAWREANPTLLARNPFVAPPWLTEGQQQAIANAIRAAI